MKKIILTLCVFWVLLISGIVVSNPINKSNMNDTLNQGSFEAKLGLKNETEASLSLDGLFRDFRGRHILFGTLKTGYFIPGRFGFLSKQGCCRQTGIRLHRYRQPKQPWYRGTGWNLSFPGFLRENSNPFQPGPNIGKIRSHRSPTEKNAQNSTSTSQQPPHRFERLHLRNLSNFGKRSNPTIEFGRDECVW